MDVNAILDRYLAYLRLERGKPERSIEAISSQLNHIRRLLGDLPAGLKAHQIDDYKLKRLEERTNRNRPPSRSTINRELTYLRAAMRRAKRHEIIDDVPAFDMYSEADRVRTGFIEPALFRRMLEAIRGRFPDTADLMEYLYATGWRRGEAETLTWDRVSWDSQVIELPAGRKRERIRRIPIAGAVNRILRRRWELRLFEGALIPWVFHRRGRRFGAWRKAWQIAKDAVGRPDLVPHDMRRSFTRNMVRRGVDRKVVMQITGHQTDSMFLRYQIVDDADLRRALEQT